MTSGSVVSATAGCSCSGCCDGDGLGGSGAFGIATGGRGPSAGRSGATFVPRGLRARSAFAAGRVRGELCRAGPAEGCGPLWTGPDAAGSCGASRTTDALRSSLRPGGEGGAGPRPNATTAP